MFLVPNVYINGNIKFLEGYKGTIFWNKYRSEIITQTKKNFLDYLIDLTFRNINRFVVVSYKSGNDETTRDSFDYYSIPLVEIIGFNALIDNKHFFGQPIKNTQEAYKKLVEMSSYLYHQKKL